jgi:hypothetical protein
MRGAEEQEEEEEEEPRENGLVQHVSWRPGLQTRAEWCAAGEGRQDA